MSCVGNTCGTGGWGGPQPGDPDNNVTLTALPAFGGIDVSWTYPQTNPFAVSFVELWRADSNVLASAIKIKDVPGTEYFDRVPANATHWYWIRLVSINGTYNEFIGPASATARSSVEQTLKDLTSMIDAGMLSQELKKSIAGIEINGQTIYKEVQDRLAANKALQDALKAVQNSLGQAETYILNEITERIEADSALVNQVSVIAAGIGDSAAAITEERSVRAAQDAVLAKDISTIYGRVQNAEGAILDISELEISPTSALATKLNSLTTDASGARSAVVELSTSLANGTHALASKVTAVESTVNGNTATGQVGLSTKVDNVSGAMNSMWTAQVQANGLIGGFGINNNGQLVEAGFDVDRFFVGRTGPDKIKPFIIADGVVYINSAAINRLEVSKITSGDMDAEWRMRGQNGRIVIDNGTVMKVQGTGFGQYRDLITWFGPSMPISACNRQNAKSFEAIDGSAYFGGTLSAGTLSNAKQSTQTAPDAYVELGPFRSNGNPRTIVVGYGFNIFMQASALGNGRYIYDGGETWADVQLFREGTLIAGQRFNGSYFIANEIDGPDTAGVSIGGSFTFTDTGPARDYTYTARIVGRSAAEIRHSSGQSSGSNVAQTLSIISSEQ
jgi:hypothetical protein